MLQRVAGSPTAHRVGHGHGSNKVDVIAPRAISSVPPLYRKAACACGGGCPSCQTNAGNLKVSQPNDVAEIEAEQVADRVMRMSVDDANPKSNVSHTPNAIHRKCDACEQGEEEFTDTPVMRKEAFAPAASTPPPADTPPSIKSVINSGGRPLDRETRNFFEPRFGADLNHVRVHTDTSAAQTARSITARAFTLGSHIVFGSGEYRPDSESGRYLLAHELAHTIQQRNGSEAGPSSLSPDGSINIRSSEVGLSRSPDPGRKAVVCPGGGPPLNGVCMSDEILDALPQADFDLEKAQEMVLADEAKTARARRRQERTINTFESDKLASLVAAYQEALEQYLSKQDDTTKRHYRSALRQLQRRYHHLVDLFLKDPKFEKKYDLRTLQQIVGEQSPQIAAYRAQDINEYLSMPQWNDNERRQMEQLKKAIGGWTGEEQELARNLLWRWFELARGGRHPSTAKDTIIDMTEQHLEQWLRAADRAREQDCKQNPMGTVEKLYRIHGIDRCKPLFDEKHPKSTVFPGPHTLMVFRMKMNLRLSEKESPESLVFECVQQYRQETNIDEQLKAMQAQALVGMGLHLTSIANMATVSMMTPPNLRPTISDNLNSAPSGVGRIVNGPDGMPHKVLAITPEGVELLHPIVKVPPANRALPSGPLGLADVPTAKPPIGVARPGAGTFMPSQTAPFEAQTALPPGSIFLQEPARAPAGLDPGPPFLSQTQPDNLNWAPVSPLSTTPSPVATVASGEIVSPHAPALGPSVPAQNQPKVYVRFQPETFATQDAAAIDALTLSNPQSIAAGRELAGQTFQTPQGRWGYSGPVMIPEEQSISKGRIDSRPQDAAVHPDWGIAAGDFHTHGSYQSVLEGNNMVRPPWKPDNFRLQQTPKEPDTMFWKHADKQEYNILPDVFSPGDLVHLTAMAREAGTRWFSYVGTPSGKFRMMSSDPGGTSSDPEVIYPPGATDIPSTPPVPGPNTVPVHIGGEGTHFQGERRPTVPQDEVGFGRTRIKPDTSVGDSLQKPAQDVTELEVRSSVADETIDGRDLADDGYHTMTGLGKPPSQGTVPLSKTVPTAAAQAQAIPPPVTSPEYLFHKLGQGVDRTLPPPLPKQAIKKPISFGEFQAGLTTADEAYAAYNRALLVSDGREVGISHNARTGEYRIMVGTKDAVRTPIGSEWKMLLHYHPNPQNILRYRWPAQADFESMIRPAWVDGVSGREFVEFTIPGVGRGRTEFGIDASRKTYYVIFHQQDGSTKRLEFANEIEYLKEYRKQER